MIDPMSRNRVPTAVQAWHLAHAWLIYGFIPGAVLWTLFGDYELAALLALLSLLLSAPLSLLALG